MDRRDKVELFEQILRGHQRVETERLIAFRSHWGFQTEFCNPARGNEKGGVEGEVGYFRRNHLVPVPRVESLEELKDRKSTRLNSSHVSISYAVFCLKKKK